MDIEEDMQKICIFGVSLCFIGRSRGHSYVHRVSILCFSRQNRWSSLMYASQNGHVEVVDKLLQHGATVDLQDKVRSH